MNTNNLAKHYQCLTPAERLPLILAAGMRDDKVEHKRLVESAAKVCVEMSDYAPLAKAHLHVEKLFVLTVLELAAKFWFWLGLWMTMSLKNKPKRSRTRRRAGAADEAIVRESRSYSRMRYHAYQLVTHVDAWMKFCAERNCDPQATLQYESTWETAAFSAREARKLAFTFEEACKFLVCDDLSEGETLPEVMPQRAETVPGLVRGWYVLLDDVLKREGG